MDNRKSFLKGAFCGALAILLVIGVVSCGVKANIVSKGNKTVTSDTEQKLSILHSLIEESFLGEVDEKKLKRVCTKGISVDLMILILSIMMQKILKHLWSRQRASTAV